MERCRLEDSDVSGEHSHRFGVILSSLCFGYMVGNRLCHIPAHHSPFRLMNDCGILRLQKTYVELSRKILLSRFFWYVKYENKFHWLPFLFVSQTARTDSVSFLPRDDLRDWLGVKKRISTWRVTCNVSKRVTDFLQLGCFFIEILVNLVSGNFNT